jgi:hypothetical protein
MDVLTDLVPKVDFSHGSSFWDENVGRSGASVHHPSLDVTGSVDAFFSQTHECASSCDHQNSPQ